jgi:hypothetical protein
MASRQELCSETKGPGSNPHKVLSFCEVRGHGDDDDDDDDHERSSKNVYLQC